MFFLNINYRCEFCLISIGIDQFLLYNARFYNFVVGKDFSFLRKGFEYDKIFFLRKLILSILIMEAYQAKGGVKSFIDHVRNSYFLLNRCYGCSNSAEQCSKDIQFVKFDNKIIFEPRYKEIKQFPYYILFKVAYTLPFKFYFFYDCDIFATDFLKKI